MELKIGFVLFVFLIYLLISCESIPNFNINGVWEIESVYKFDSTNVGKELFVYISDTTMSTWAKEIGYTNRTPYKLINNQVSVGGEDPFTGNISVISKDSFLVENDNFQFSYIRIQNMSEEEFYDERKLYDFIKRGKPRWR